MNTITKNFVGASIAFVALVSLTLPFFALADYEDYGGYSGDTSYDAGYDYSGDTSYDYSPDTSYDYSSDTYDNGSYDYGSSYGSGYSAPSFGGSGYSYSMPSFGSANYNYRQTYFPQYTAPSNTNTVVTTNTNTCTNNSCNSSYVDNSIVDNSVKVSNSYNNQQQKQRGYDYNQSNCSNYNYGNQYGYGQQGYNYGSYNYQGNCYSYSAPITFPVNTTPYITLSQAPYTGLDLGPFGEVLYWTFLVLWCLGAAYLVVVKRVQNKLVGFLNGFLFGGTAKTVAHSAHAPQAHAAAPAPLVEDGIDPFIKSQIKRA
jgi:hypothetical protein